MVNFWNNLFEIIIVVIRTPDGYEKIKKIDITFENIFNTFLMIK